MPVLPGKAQSASKQREQFDHIGKLNGIAAVQAPDDPAEYGFYRHQGGRSSQLTNFSIALTRRVREQDDVTPTQRFRDSVSRS